MIAFAELAIPLYAPRTMKHKLWLTLIACLAYRINKELWKALG